MRIRGLILCGLVITLAACSRVELAYDNADWWLARQVGSYLELERGQRGLLRDELAEYRQFHQAVRMPEIAELLESIDTLLSMPQPTKAAVAETFDRGEVLIRLAAADAVPLAVNTLKRLNEAQIVSLEAALEEGRQTYVEEVAPARAERLEERAAEWLGSITTEQVDLLNRCERQSPDIRDEWMAWRSQLDARLAAALQAEAGRQEMAALMHEWWLDDRARGNFLFSARQQTRAIWLECTYQMLLTLDAQQRDAIRSRLNRYLNGITLIAER